MRRVGVPLAEDGDVHTAGWGKAVRIWGPLSGRQIGHNDGAIRRLVTTVAAGRPVAVTAGPVANAGVLRTWDLATGEKLGPDLRFPFPIGGHGPETAFLSTL
ncbi:hypothetical protein GCM10009678_84570 [Actinomadura kijaniata]|uniref:Uncharacterized protein n=1 Tax=Actinomadura namibiensis TaxID=182080 RepID=A0A7W3LVI2_ACTNM|nr:hypothetical protein [Actinomadura namibiensis]MBA8955111.1 hypothetical protein [Actinomadura namibiensis]